MAAVRLQVELIVEAGAIRGSVWDGDAGAAREFHGWLELIAAVSAAERAGADQATVPATTVSRTSGTPGR